MSYTPDKWVVVKITSDEYGTIYKVLAGFYGGYLNSDSWQLNSGIVEVQNQDNKLAFIGTSGNVYFCDIKKYGLTGLTSIKLENIIAAVEKAGATCEVMPESTNFFELDYWKVDKK